ncbi:MAG: hypothetical protein IJQ02_14255 [Oscillospiraceae bacterium]|nr:hypothetical protein [Oscillospiraceae bacterium]
MADKRMAGDYEIIQSMMIGDKEIVLGENPKDTSGLPYMCAFCEDNGIIARFYDAVGGDDFCEIAQEYGQRITKQAEKTRQALLNERAGLDGNSIITAAQCEGISSEDDLNGKIIVIKPEALRREYRAADHQLKLCTGGFGASPNSRGSACFCTDLRTGKESRFERRDVLGTMRPEKLPQWAKDGLATIQQAEKSRNTRGKKER